MYTPVPIARRQLLKQIHVTKLHIAMLIYLVFQSCEKTVLVKIIVDNLLTKIDV